VIANYVMCVVENYVKCVIASYVMCVVANYVLCMIANCVILCVMCVIANYVSVFDSIEFAITHVVFLINIFVIKNAYRVCCYK
jgi:hypothetical protein